MVLFVEHWLLAMAGQWFMMPLVVACTIARRLSRSRERFLRFECEKKICFWNRLGGESVLRNKLRMGSVGSLKVPITPPQITLKITVFTRRFVIVPAEKREEFVKILADMIKRLLVLINAHRTDTRVRLKAMTVLSELLNTSYTMVRDVEVEELERETEGLEEEAKQPQTEDKAEEDQAKATS
jgi:hypothetical protein